MDQNEIVPPVKDDESELPIATEWRPVFCEIVRALVKGDYALSGCSCRVRLRKPDIAAHIRAYIADYGATLVDLPEATWKTSIALWMGHFWEVFVDLWTAEEGRSDMVLSVHVSEDASGFQFEVQLVYVP